MNGAPGSIVAPETFEVHDVGTQLYLVFMVVRLLSPFPRTYSKLDFQRAWWHRLALVGLVLCVAVAFASTLALTLGSDLQALKGAPAATTATPIQSEHGPWEQYAEITSLPTLPKGYSAVVILSGQGERIQFPADTTRGELIKALCEHLKQGDAACWEIVSESPAPAQGHKDGGSAPAARGFWRVFVRDIGTALAISFCVNYLLQLSYRAVVFVVFGKSDEPAVASH